jgi:hypothetical protein
MKQFVKSMIIFMVCFIVKCKMDIIIGREVGTMCTFLGKKEETNECGNAVGYRRRMYHSGL